jgi:hypothetical protein
MRTLKLLSIGLVGAGLLAACGDDTGTGTTSSTSTGGGGTGGSTTTSTGGGGGGTGGGLTIPELGPQVDRMGRPAINTALDDTFVLAAGGLSTDAARGASEDAYNENAAENTWVSTHMPSAALQLAILDSLDDNCTNALLCADPSSNTSCYGAIATILTKDRLWVRSDGDNCTAAAPADPDTEGYLAVELAALGIANADCGGRRPVDDVIKRTYSAVALGATTGFDDAITAPATLHPESFPYLAAPH